MKVEPDVVAQPVISALTGPEKKKKNHQGSRSAWAAECDIFWDKNKEVGGRKEKKKSSIYSMSHQGWERGRIDLVAC